MPYAILTLILIALDQLVKYQVLQNIAPGEYIPFLPHILDLTYVENTGAAFSMLEDYTWLLTGISMGMSAILALALWKNYFRHPIGKLTLTLLLAGAVGNLIDRVVRGYVVDMFHVLFMNFAVFNVADICVVVGGFGAALYYLFLQPKLEKPEESHDQPNLDT